MKKMVAFLLFVSMLFCSYMVVYSEDGFDDDLAANIRDIIENQKGYYSIALKDLETGDELLINNKVIRSASVIKIYVMIEAFRQISFGKLDINEKIVLKDSMKVGGTGILQRSKVGTKITYKRLIELMMTVSDNTATNMLINRLGMDNINESADFLGCKDTRIENLLMKARSNKSKKYNTTSVRDLMLVLERIYRNECLGSPYDQEMIEIMTRAKSRDKLPRLIPSNCRIAHKTGRMSHYEHDAGIIYTSKGDYIICVMSMKLPSSEKGKQVIAEISKKAYNSYINN
ncbi:MAG: serine hydrolase [Caulobacteraceae bacterium]